MTHVSFAHARWLVLGLLALPRPADTMSYYDVSGSTAEALRGAINRRRPIAIDGLRHDATTTWGVRWEYAYAPGAGGCKVTSVIATLDLTVTMPHWVDEAKAEPVLVTQWHRYTTALLAHETGHKNIAVAARAAIADSMARIGPQSDCIAMRKLLDRTASTLLAKYRADELRFDAETNHGIRRGASFP